MPATSLRLGTGACAVRPTVLQMMMALAPGMDSYIGLDFEDAYLPRAGARARRRLPPGSANRRQLNVDSRANVDVDESSPHRFHLGFENFKKGLQHPKRFGLRLWKRSRNLETADH